MSLAKRLLLKLRMIKAHTSSTTATTTSPRTSYPVENVATTGTAASTTLPSPLSSSTRDDDDDLLLLRRVFSEFDKNGDGRISAAELGQVSRAIASLDGGLVEPDADAAVAALDLDGDGSIDFHEFTACLRPAGDGNAASAPGNGSEPSCSSREDDAECLRSAFAVYDCNGDGVITAEELQLVLTKLMGNGNNSTSLADCKMMIRAVDRNGDGVVSFEEFAAMMTQRKPARIPGSTVVTA